uniref:Leishmanolysin-like peptidase n=1 Tax=Haemonchus contortus TaxID=6289 RepID=A0A7I4YPQ5_HAECO
MLFDVVRVVLTIEVILACHYVPLKPEQVLVGKTEYPAQSRSRRDASRDWIRIKIEYDASVNQLNEEKRKVLERLVTVAHDYFESTLKVKRLLSLQLPQLCIEKDGNFSMSTKCSGHCEKRCGEAVAPQSANYFKCCKCVNGECTGNQSSCGGKLTGTDFVLFVSVLEHDCHEFALAYAWHCGTDEITNRPIAGHVNICPQKFLKMETSDFSHWSTIVNHELVHAFVFSQTLFRMFPGAGKSRQGELMGLVPNVLDQFTRVDWETSKGSVKHDVYMIITPRLREEARRHFNCSTLEGAEIENQGMPGTLGVHWEKRVFENELMSGVPTQVFAMSRVTLALFEDSGWYSVDYNKAEDMAWGRNLGCTFATKSCLTWMKSNPTDAYPFCTILDDSRCSPTRREKLSCSLATVEHDLPPEFNYNTGDIYHNKKGKAVFGFGQLVVADYCPYYMSYGVSTQDGFNSICTHSGDFNDNGDSFEIFSPTARCFHSYEGIDLVHDGSSFKWRDSLGCYESTCKNNLLMIRPQNSTFHSCDRQGQFINFEKRLHDIGTIKLRIECPSCSELCGAQLCSPGGLTVEHPTGTTKSVEHPTGTTKTVEHPTGTIRTVEHPTGTIKPQPRRAIEPRFQLTLVLLLILLLCS